MLSVFAILQQSETAATFYHYEEATSYEMHLPLKNNIAAFLMSCAAIFLCTFIGYVTKQTFVGYFWLVSEKLEFLYNNKCYNNKCHLALFTEWIGGSVVTRPRATR